MKTTATKTRRVVTKTGPLPKTTGQSRPISVLVVNRSLIIKLAAATCPRSPVDFCVRTDTPNPEKCQWFGGATGSHVRCLWEKSE